MATGHGDLGSASSVKDACGRNQSTPTVSIKRKCILEYMRIFSIDTLRKKKTKRQKGGGQGREGREGEVQN